MVGIHGFHLGIVLREAHGIGPGVVGLPGWIGVAVHFPTATDFVADFPVFKIAMVGDIHHGDSVSGFLGCAAAIVGDDKGLGLGIGGRMDEVGGKGTPGSRVCSAVAPLFVRPMVAVAPTAAGPAQDLNARVGQLGQGSGIVFTVFSAIPSGVVGTDQPGAHGAHGLGGVDVHMDDGGRRFGGQ